MRWWDMVLEFPSESSWPSDNSYMIPFGMVSFHINREEWSGMPSWICLDPFESLNIRSNNWKYPHYELVVQDIVATAGSARFLSASVGHWFTENHVLVWDVVPLTSQPGFYSQARWIHDQHRHVASLRRMSNSWAPLPDRDQIDHFDHQSWWVFCRTNIGYCIRLLAYNNIMNLLAMKPRTMTRINKTNS